MREKVVNFVSVATVLLEGIFLFGIALGFPNFVNLCRENGVYSHVCKNDENTTKVGCPEQSAIFNRLSS